MIPHAPENRKARVAARALEAILVFVPEKNNSTDSGKQELSPKQVELRKRPLTRQLYISADLDFLWRRSPSRLARRAWRFSATCFKCSRTMRSSSCRRLYDLGTVGHRHRLC